MVNASLADLPAAQRRLRAVSAAAERDARQDASAAPASSEAATERGALQAELVAIEEHCVSLPQICTGRARGGVGGHGVKRRTHGVGRREGRYSRQEEGVVETFGGFKSSSRV